MSTTAPQTNKQFVQQCYDYLRKYEPPRNQDYSRVFVKVEERLDELQEELEVTRSRLEGELKKANSLNEALLKALEQISSDFVVCYSKDEMDVITEMRACANEAIARAKGRGA